MTRPEFGSARRRGKVGNHSNLRMGKGGIPSGLNVRLRHELSIQQSSITRFSELNQIL